jgi:hypothetical protein
VSSSPPPRPFAILPDPGHCWGQGVCGLKEEHETEDFALPCASPTLWRPLAECRRARGRAPPLSWQPAGAPRCQAAASELPAAQAHCKQPRVRPPRPEWEPHPNTMSLLVPGRGLYGRVWRTRAPTPPPRPPGPRSQFSKPAGGRGALGRGESQPVPSRLNVCFVPENKGSIRLLPPGKHKTSF